MSGSRRSVRLAVGIHRVLTALLLPGWFRERSGRPMAADFEEEAVGRSGLAVLRLIAAEAVDLAIAGVRVRRSGSESRASGSGRTMPLGDVGRDVLVAGRMWRKSPGFLAVTVATLALGVGAATAIWTLADGVLFRPLPHTRPSELMVVSGTTAEMPDSRFPVSWPNYVDLRAAPDNGFADMAASTGAGSPTVVIGETPEALRAGRVTANTFAVLGNEAVAGRAFGLADGEDGAPPVVVMSETLWRTRFGSDPGVVGSTLRVAGSPYEVVGVMPAAFAFPSPGLDLWLPLRPSDAIRDRDTNYLRVVGRLDRGVTMTEASARLRRAMARLVETYPEDNEGKAVRLTPLREVVIGDARPAMLLLLGASGLLLLLACANLANLLLARGAVRVREMAVRSALGARRARLVGQMVVETLVLAAVGGALGVLLARALVRVLLALAPANLPRAAEIALDGRAFLFAAFATLSCALLFGLAPAWRATKHDPSSSLREGVRGTGGGGRQRGLRLLVVAQLALALLLVSGGGLLAFSLHRLTSVDPGFDAQGVFVFRVAPPGAAYPGPEEVHAFYDRLLARVAAIPGVTTVGATWDLPFGDDLASGRVTVEGRPLPAGKEPVIGIVPVRGDYFATLRIPLVAGRPLAATDDATGPPVVLVNGAAARALWPGEDAVGKRFRRGRAEEVDLPWITVVGVVADTRASELSRPAEPRMYWTHAQSGAWARDLNILVRSSADAAALAAPVRRAVADVDPNLPITRAGLLADRITASVAEPRFRAILLAAFSVLALLLAVVGTYGVMAFVVAQRGHEIGVRIALGADPWSVSRSVLWEGLRLAGLAVALGLAATFAFSRLLGGLLFDVRPLDPRVHGAAAVVLVAASLAACWLPARRASRVDPLRALKD